MAGRDGGSTMGQRWRMSRQERAEANAVKVEAAQTTLRKSVASLQSGDDWQRFLRFQAKLHAYSPRNVMLISQQAMERGFDPTYVAGFQTWKALGRQVNKGEKGLMVLAPVSRKLRSAETADGETRLLRKGEEPAAGETVRESRPLVGFKVEYTFDMSQTSGEAVPERPEPKLLEGEAPEGLGLAVMRLLETKGYTVEPVEDAQKLNGANGATFFAARQVRVRFDMDDAAQTKTLIHEAAHVLLHENPPGNMLSRSRKEVEAESVAFVVCHAHGMATDDYSFPYIGTWAENNAEKAVLATAQRVGQAANQILEVSPAEHVAGGRVPGAEAAIEKRRQEVAGPAEPALATEDMSVGV